MNIGINHRERTSSKTPGSRKRFLAVIAIAFGQLIPPILRSLF
ncbi:hypothetical protein [Hyella patelloides]|nr:hypothetical protein [Hyella patelloides]